MSGSKALKPHKLACMGLRELGTRRNMRMQWGRGPAKSECFVGSWKHEVRSDP